MKFVFGDLKNDLESVFNPLPRVTYITLEAWIYEKFLHSCLNISLPPHSSVCYAEAALLYIFIKSPSLAILLKGFQFSSTSAKCITRENSMAHLFSLLSLTLGSSVHLWGKKEFYVKMKGRRSEIRGGLEKLFLELFFLFKCLALSLDWQMPPIKTLLRGGRIHLFCNIIFFHAKSHEKLSQFKESPKAYKISSFQTFFFWQKSLIYELRDGCERQFSSGTHNMH